MFDCRHVVYLSKDSEEPRKDFDLCISKIHKLFQKLCMTMKESFNNWPKVAEFDDYLFAACWQQISFRFHHLFDCVILHKIIYKYVLYQGRLKWNFLKATRITCMPFLIISISELKRKTLSWAKLIENALFELHQTVWI